MRDFSQLLDALVYTRSRTAKLKLIGDYLKRTPDPDRGYALAALTGELNLPAVKPAAIRAIAEERVDPVLLYMSRDYVGDMAETVSLLWPKRDRAARRPRRRHACGSPAWSSGCAALGRAEAPARARRDARPSRRERPLRLAEARHRRAPHRHLGAARQDRARRRPSGSTSMRSRRSGTASARLICRSSTGRKARGAQPTAEDVPVFRPFMLAHPLDELRVSMDDYAAEWKWDGIRVQLVHAGGETRLYSRAGDDITGSFPDVAEAFAARACSTANCWSRAPSRARRRKAAKRRASTRSSKGSAASSSRRRCSRDYPAFVRLYDILFDGKEDVRGLALTERRDAARSLRRRARSANGSTFRR